MCEYGYPKKPEASDTRELDLQVLVSHLMWVLGAKLCLLLEQSVTLNPGILLNSSEKFAEYHCL